MSLNATRKYRKTPKGVLTNLYHKQIERCLKKGKHLPTYTLKELHARFLNDEKYIKIFENWAANGFQYYDTPSIDRNNPELGYTMDNIQIMSWLENRAKGDQENAQRFTTAIVMMDRDGNELRQFESLKEASEELGISQGLISMCCQGKRNHTRGYVFKYRGDKFRKRNLYENPELTK